MRAKLAGVQRSEGDSGHSASFELARDEGPSKSGNEEAAAWGQGIAATGEVKTLGTVGPTHGPLPPLQSFYF
jgi:hypothetical protein